MNQEREEIAILIRAIFGSNSIRTFMKINSNFNGLIPVCDILKFTCYQDCRFGKVPLDRNCSSARMDGREIRLPEIIAIFNKKIWSWKVHFCTALNLGFAKTFLGKYLDIRVFLDEGQCGGASDHSFSNYSCLQKRHLNLKFEDQLE